MSYKKRTGICITKYCRKPQSKKGGGFCSRCKMRTWRACQPMKARLAHLRDHANQKGIPFDLDLEWLDGFLTRNGYDPTLHHIDRISALGGYTKGNLQILPSSENVAKGNRERHGHMQLF